jgi:hypothetical protein
MIAGHFRNVLGCGALADFVISLMLMSFIKPKFFNKFYKVHILLPVHASGFLTSQCIKRIFWDALI